jgi:hypothetical protein
MAYHLLQDTVHHFHQTSMQLENFHAPLAGEGTITILLEHRPMVVRGIHFWRHLVEQGSGTVRAEFALLINSGFH